MTMNVWRAVIAAGMTLAGVLGPAGVEAAPRSTHQAVETGKGAGAVYEHLANPCTGIMHALLELGVNPLSEDERVRQLGRSAWSLMLPVLAEVAANPTLADDPAVLRGCIRDQVTASLRGENVYYSPTRAEVALVEIGVAALDAGFAADLWRRGFGPPPAAGQLLVLSIVTDPERWATWWGAGVGMASSGADPEVCTFAR